MIQCFLTHKWLFLVHVISRDSLRHCPLPLQWHYFEKVWFSELSPYRNLRIALLDLSPKSKILHVGFVHHAPYQIPANTGEVGLNTLQILKCSLAHPPLTNSLNPRHEPWAAANLQSFILFKDRKSETHRGEVICPTSQNYWGKLGCEP